MLIIKEQYYTIPWMWENSCEPKVQWTLGLRHMPDLIVDMLVIWEK